MFRTNHNILLFQPVYTLGHKRVILSYVYVITLGVQFSSGKKQDRSLLITEYLFAGTCGSDCRHLIFGDGSPATKAHTALALTHIATILQAAHSLARLVHIIGSDVSHVTCGAHGHTGLRCSFVGAVLQTNGGLTFASCVISSDVSYVTCGADGHTRLRGTLVVAHLATKNGLAFCAHVISSDVSHVTCGAHGHTSLRGTLVVAHLATKNALAFCAHVISSDVSYVTCGAHSHTRLGSTFVVTSLSTKNSLASLVHVISSDVSHVTCGTHGHTRLRCTFVGTSLETNNTLAGLQLLLSELNHVLLCGFGTNGWSIEIVPLGLCAQCLDTAEYLGHVTTFKQIDGLELIDLWNTIFLAEVEEDFNIFHLFEGGRQCVEFELHTAGFAWCTGGPCLDCLGQS